MTRIISVMSEIGAGTRGASMGFDALKTASFKIDRRFFKKYKVEPLPHENQKLFEDVTMPYAKRLDGVARMYERIEESVSSVISAGDFPVVITGDHSNGGGVLAGVKKAIGDKRMGVIWIDAHADLHSPYTSPSGNVHGMPLATALGEDNLEHRVKDIPEETAQYWNRMKGEKPRLRPEDLVFIGLRDCEEPEIKLMEKHGIPNLSVEEVRMNGAKEIMKGALDHLDACDCISLSFDVDSLDPSISRGTGTPVPGGLKEEEATELILTALESDKICCLEVTEINPTLDDKGNAMGETAFRILKKAVERIDEKFKG